MIGAVLLGHLAGRCTGYVAGFVAGAVMGDVPAWSSAGTALGSTIGWIAFSVVLLVGWVLVCLGQRHHEAEIKRAPRERPSPPPALVRHGLLTVFGVPILGLVMIPAALGVWLGSVMASAFGADTGLWATALPALGGVLGLGLPFILWHRTR